MQPVCVCVFGCILPLVVVRFVFADLWLEVVGILFSMPAAQTVRRGWTRYLARAACRIARELGAAAQGPRTSVFTANRESDGELQESF